MLSGQNNKPRTRIEVRVKPAEKMVVEAVARRLGLTVSGYVKKLLFDNLYFEIEKQRLEIGTGEDGF